MPGHMRRRLDGEQRTPSWTDSSNGWMRAGLLAAAPRRSPAVAGRHRFFYTIQSNSGGLEAPRTAPFESAGGHWNPTSGEHGKDNPQGAHLGPTTTDQIRPAMAGVVQTP